MDMNKLTQKSQEAVQNAQAKAVRFGHQEIDGEHLLLALLDEGGLMPRLLEKMDVEPDALRRAVTQELESRPSVGGPGAEPGKIFVTQRLQKFDLGILQLDKNNGHAMIRLGLRRRNRRP